ncbi:MAG: helix-turn-helix domain-containing protein [Clostridia bacterium]|nr:helix-turn-helix domain-containing protein [Clostridia bacterium]
MKEALSLRGMKQSELVKLTGIGKSSISTYLSGEYEPKQRNIYKIAQALNVSEAWLMGYDVPSSTEYKSIPNGFNPLPRTVKKPRLGVISCGDPIMSEENFDGYDEVPEHINCDFTLLCEGDSMIGARICDGDTVYIKQQPTVENGQIAAILIDGTEKLLKRVYITDDSIVLQAENPAYPPRSFFKEDMNRVSIIGRAVGFYSNIK